ncbi:hypothetical protein AB0J83_12125 [Actinoplanes sp. NPDC049596]|uniref:hypothetical protein n=1 Tax=unclassified Actinoplanes TaxID=2626549 RepID=UPI00343C3F18
MRTVVRNNWSRLAMALVLAVGGLVGFTPARATAAACYAGSCDYWDPGTAGCTAGSQVRSEYTLRSWRYKVMYSPACHAGWAEVTSGQYDCVAPYLHLLVRTSSVGSPVSRRVKHITTCLDVGQTARTTMASYNYWLQTCASNLDNDISPAGRCTGIV